MSLVLGQPKPFLNKGIQFVENATQDYDYGVHTDLPDTFGDAEFTLKVVIEPSQVTTIGDTENSPGIRENWADESASPGDSSTWWYYGNFLLDGHNNNNFTNGTCSIQVRASGIPSWTFGDGSASVPTGDVWGIQDLSGTNILDGSRHILHCVRRWQSSPANSADLELWVDGSLQDTVNSDVRTNMATSYWDSWTGYPASQGNWIWGAEKQAALGLNSVNDWPDYKGIIREIAFYGGALSSEDIANDQGVALTNHADYLDRFKFGEGSGTSTTSENGIVMTLGNAQSGGFWPNA